MPSVNLSRERHLYTAFSERAVDARQMEMARLQQDISSGYRISQASDDPPVYIQARQMEQLTNRYDQYERSITSARTWVDQTQSALDNLSELYTQVYEEGVRILNDSFSDGDRDAAASRMESVLTEIVERLNSKSGDEYLFAGSQTTGDAPFQQIAGVYTYTGNDDDRLRQISRGPAMKINITGEDLHTMTDAAGAPVGDITDAVETLIDRVRNGTTDQIATALDTVIQARDHVIDQSAEAGNIGRRLHLAQQQLVDARMVAEERRSELEDTDIAKAMVDFQKTQTGLQAALRVAATVLNTSLLDYLR